MKKILLGLLAVMMLATAAVFTGCKSCKSETKSGGEAAAVVYLKERDDFVPDTGWEVPEEVKSEE